MDTYTVEIKTQIAEISWKCLTEYQAWLRFEEVMKKHLGESDKGLTTITILSPNGEPLACWKSAKMEKTGEISMKQDAPKWEGVK